MVETVTRQTKSKLIATRKEVNIKQQMEDLESNASFLYMSSILKLQRQQVKEQVTLSQKVGFLLNKVGHEENPSEK